MKYPNRRGVLMIPCVVALAALTLFLGLAGAVPVSASRRVLELGSARRMLELATASALEEACAQIEEYLPPVAYSTPGRLRSPGLETGTFPFTCQLRVTPADFAPEGIKLDPVRVQWSGFQRQERLDKQGRARDREIAIVQLEVGLQATTRNGTVKRWVTVRRYVGLQPNAGDNALRFRVLPGNLLVVTKDA